MACSNVLENNEHLERFFHIYYFFHMGHLCFYGQHSPCDVCARAYARSESDNIIKTVNCGHLNSWLIEFKRDDTELNGCVLEASRTSAM